MAFTAFNSTEIAAGQPVKQELWQKVKDNFDDHETRISNLQTAASTVAPFVFAVYGPHYHLTTPATEVALMRVPYAITLTDVKLFIVDDGSSGTLQVDIQKKSGAGAFSTVFSTKPSIASGAGDYSTSTNGALSVFSVSNGDFLRLDISTAMIGNNSFYVYLYHTVG